MSTTESNVSQTPGLREEPQNPAGVSNVCYVLNCFRVHRVHTHTHTHTHTHPHTHTPSKNILECLRKHLSHTLHPKCNCRSPDSHTFWFIQSEEHTSELQS